ncbi:MAG: glycosyltransferase [Nitrospira sp.]|nr:glycosyltransferase [Nitrospira sp.]MBS0173705.1 glycosyltransferase [Nitrospira sp.]
MKVLVVSTSFPLHPDDPSGIFVRKMVESLPLDIEITVLTPANHLPTVNTTHSNRYRLKIFNYALRRWQLLAQQPGGIPAALRSKPVLRLLVPALLLALLMACIREGRKVDLIHAQWLATGLVCGLAGLLIRRPVITTVRGTDGNRLDRSVLNRLILRVAARFNRRIITVSEALAAAVRPFCSGTGVDTIANGVDLSEKPPHAQKHESGRPRNLLSVANLIPGKGLDCVLRALANESLSHWQLTIVGDGPEAAALQRLAEQLGLADRCQFTGRIAPSRVPEYLATADAFVLASHSEGRPNALLEAMAAGLPALVTPLPGVLELVEAETSALVFPVNDDRALALNLKRLDDDPELGHQLGRAARQRIDALGLHWNATGNAYSALYRQILVDARRP